MQRALILLILLLGIAFTDLSFAAKLPCFNMQDNPGQVGETLTATYDTCEGADQPIASPGGDKAIQLYPRWYHIENNAGAIGAESMFVGYWYPGMTWATVADWCSNKCAGWLVSHVQQKTGQICIQLVQQTNPNTDIYQASPAPPTCIVVGNECDFDTPNTSINFPTGSVNDLQGTTQATTVNLQCGDDADVRYTLRNSQSTITDGNNISLYSGSDGKITGQIFIDGHPFTTEGIVFNESSGNNPHEIGVTLNINGEPVGEHTGSFILVSEIQ